MTGPLPNADNRAAANNIVNDFVSRLSEQQKMLIVLKSKLYDGRWDAMLDDLKNRLAGKPYIFKLVNRIKDDIESIEQLQAFEKANDIDLAQFVQLAG